MNKITYSVFALVVLNVWIALAKRPDFSQIPGYAETQARLLQRRSEKTVVDEHTARKRDFSSMGVKLDDDGSYLRYQADMKKGVVSLDFEETVEDLVCGPARMKITQRVTGNEHKFNTGEYISASALWKCGKNMPVYRKVTGVESEDYSADGKFLIVTVTTIDVPFTELFDYLSANTYHTGYSEMIAKKNNHKELNVEELRKNMAHYERGTRIEKIAIIEPTQYDEFSSGDDINVKWDYQPNGGENQNVNIILYSVQKDGTTSLKDDCHWEGAMTEKTAQFPSSCFTEGNRYKFGLKYNIEGSSCDIVYSSIIAYAKQSESHSLDVTKPEFGASFTSGQTLSVTWEEFEWPNGATVDVYLYKDVNGPDTLLYSYKGVSVSSKGCQFTIPAKSDVGSGSDYYIFVGYECGDYWCSEGFYSKKFSINYDAPFVITNELNDYTVYFPNFDRTVTWTTTLPSSTEIYVSVKAQYPSIIPLPDKTLTYVQTTAGALSAVVHPPKGTIFPAYYEISYDCMFFGHLCSTVSSKTFKLVDFHGKSWNVDEEKNVIAEPKYTFAKVDCDSVCKNSGASGSLFCKACDAGIDMSASATCENCYALAKGGFYDLTLEFVGSRVEAFKVGFYGQVWLQLSLSLQASAEIHKENNYNIFTHTITIAGFFVGPIHLGIGIILTGDIPITFDMEASLQGLVQSKGYIHLFAEAQYGDLFPDDQRRVFVEAQRDDDLSPSFEFNAHAEATLSAALKLGASATFADILELNSYVEGKATLHGEMEQFSGLGREKLYENSTFAFGSCRESHRLEYYLGLSASAHADAKFLFVKEPLFEKNHDFPYRPIILSGCMFPITSTGEEQKAYSKTFPVSGLNRSDIPVTDDYYLNLGIADGICESMNWPKGSLIAEIKTSDNSISGVNLTLSPYYHRSVLMSGKDQLEVEFAKVMQYSNASFYKTSVGKYFQGKFSDFNLVIVASSSSIIMPSFIILAMLVVLFVM